MAEKIDEYLFRDVDPERHIIATYTLTSQNFKRAAKAIAIGQSIGNPDVRTMKETPSLLENHLAKITNLTPPQPASSTGTVQIAYPLANFHIYEDGITQLMCTLMGGQMDIDIIQGCRLTNIQFPKTYLYAFSGPRFGMDEIKRRTGARGRPLLGGIVKPKTGISVQDLESMVKDLVEGGVDFIKEDEILGDPACCRFRERVPIIADLIRKYKDKTGKEVFYAACINSDFPYFLQRAQFASDYGLNAVHLNFWAGLGAYKSLRDLDLDTAIFFQKSGDKVITGKNNAFAVDFSVIAQLARMSGCDFIHAGMWGGYLSDSKQDLDKTMSALRDGDKYLQTVPSLSCGSQPGLVDTTVKTYGTDLMMNVGGAIQGHPMGTRAGAIAMRQAMVKPLEQNMHDYMQHKPELKAAIDKWGYVKP